MLNSVFHLCLDVRGALHNWSDREFKGVFKHDDGRPMTVREAKDALMDELEKGHKVIPCGPCDNFSYETGCLGHPEGKIKLRDQLLDSHGDATVTELTPDERAEVL